MKHKYKFLCRIAAFMAVLIATSISSYAVDMNIELLSKTPTTEMSLDQLNAVSQLIEKSSKPDRNNLLGILWMNLAYSKAIEADKPVLSGQDNLKAIVLTVMRDKTASLETRKAGASILVLGWKFNETSDTETIKSLYQEFENEKSPEGLRMRDALQELIILSTQVDS